MSASLPSQAGVIDVYFDFLCPYAWRGLELADVLRREHGLKFRLRHFSLVQGNHKENPDRKYPTWWLDHQVAGAGGDAQAGSLNAFLAGQAALRQGEDAAWAFTLALFRAVHQRAAGESAPDLKNDGLLRSLAEQSLDIEQFDRDFADDAGLRASLHDDLQASASLGVFGTPTFHLTDGNIAYFRFANLVTEPGAALALWNLYTAVLTDGARIETIKRAK
ncbi:DsbA family protein [Deinococcus sp. KNUC1210]|uniref:DsbA family oxidoreductase n=1 Tax=Deinococcus sp. KNUC1210 TaxID=2917691 RepID=UPI001EEFB569|nr:DsbA family protein [Deinococcus sp. KNUC1210]ULH14601.1 DsbA family protein [Deinococcus sp. KNUC1210]